MRRSSLFQNPTMIRMSRKAHNDVRKKYEIFVSQWRYSSTHPVRWKDNSELRSGLFPIIDKKSERGKERRASAAKRGPRCRFSSLWFVVLQQMVRLRSPWQTHRSPWQMHRSMTDCFAHHDKRIAYYARKHFILILYANCISLDIELCDSWEVAENPRNRVGLITISFDNEN